MSGTQSVEARTRPISVATMSATAPRWWGVTTAEGGPGDLDLMQLAADVFALLDGLDPRPRAVRYAVYVSDDPASSYVLDYDGGSADRDLRRALGVSAGVSDDELVEELRLRAEESSGDRTGGPVFDPETGELRIAELRIVPLTDSDRAWLSEIADRSGLGTAGMTVELIDTDGTAYRWGAVPPEKLERIRELLGDPDTTRL